MSETEAQFCMMSITMNDRPVGNVMFENVQQLEEFKSAYNVLIHASYAKVARNKWGYITAKFEVDENNKITFAQESSDG